MVEKSDELNQGVGFKRDVDKTKTERAVGIIGVMVSKLTASGT